MADLTALVRFVESSSRLLVLTGAGCSTGSGIPDYRAADGTWKHRRPMTYARFVGDPAMRRRYWAGGLVGWERMASAEPNPAHEALAALESAGRVARLVTQNVDGLHQRAGSRRVVDLHGRLDRVVCLSCRTRFPREGFQAQLLELNPEWEGPRATIRPDGDAEIPAAAWSGFRVPECLRCGGILKPDVVFFGESVPRRRVATAQESLEGADALLVVGSSLMVWSGYRFVRRARELGIPVAAVNLGITRAEGELDLQLRTRCEVALPEIVRRLPISARG